MLIFVGITAIFNRMHTMELLARWTPNPLRINTGRVLPSYDGLQMYIRSRILLENENAFGILCLTENTLDNERTNSILTMCVCTLSESVVSIQSCLWDTGTTPKARMDALNRLQYEYLTTFPTYRFCLDPTVLRQLDP